MEFKGKKIVTRIIPRNGLVTLIAIRESKSIISTRNYAGSKSNALDDDGYPFAAAWSLKNITFSEGSTVEWEYEVNHYDMSNGVSLGRPKYGGGIRVKKNNYLWGGPVLIGEKQYRIFIPPIRASLPNTQMQQTLHVTVLGMQQPEEQGHDFGREKIIGPECFPLLTILTNTATGYDTMYMWMVDQGLSPGMKNANSPDSPSQPFGILPKSEKRR